LILDFLSNLTADIYIILKDIVILIFVVVFAIAFFVVQYYLIKGYVWIYKSFVSLPIISQTIKRIQLNLDSKYNISKPTDKE